MADDFCLLRASQDSARASVEDQSRNSDPVEWLVPRILPEASQSQLVAETLRLHGRYLEEFVEAFNLCPWAKGSRLSNNALPLVDDGRALLDQVGDAAHHPVEIVFLILPTYVGPRAVFDEMVATLIAEDARRYHDASPPFAMAAFHPERTQQPLAALSPDTLVPFLRRSPNPTIQLVRLEALERVRKGEPAGTAFIDPSQIDFASLLKAPPAKPSLRQRVAATNHATLQGENGRAARKALEGILHDRRLTNLRLGLPPSPWELAPEGEDSLEPPI